VELQDAFEVPAEPDAVWQLLVDVPRIVPLMPGAELTDTVDERTWKGRVHAKLGPIRMSFAGTVSFEQRDDAQRRAVLRVRASESRGKGVAQATVTSAVVPIAGGTRVEMRTDLGLSGAVAQYGSGLISDVAKRMTEEFARNLAAELRGEVRAGDGVPPAPISGLRVAAEALAHGALRRIRGSDE
jgi:uncharacterized protein